MEFSEEKFKNLMAGQGAEKLTRTTAENFEELMKKNGLENIAGQYGHKFIVHGRDEGGGPFKVLEEFDTAEEAREWYNSVGWFIVEGGGEITLDYGPSKLEK